VDTGVLIPGSPVHTCIVILQAYVCFRKCDIRGATSEGLVNRICRELCFNCSEAKKLKTRDSCIARLTGKPT